MASNNTSKGPQVLALGLGRTGTLSLAVALGQLGYENVYHDQNMVADKDHFAWLEKAADAFRPDLNAPHANPAPKPFTRADWDEGFGQYDAIVDWPCFFAPSIIAAYPNAKVILTTRDFDSWFESWTQQCLKPVFGPGTKVAFYLLWLLLGFRSGYTAIKSMRCLYGGGLDTLQDYQKASRRMFDEHYARIERAVPPERLLVYRVGTDGWDPLCKFLDKEVPDTSFPWVNTKPEQTKRVNDAMGEVIKQALLRWIAYAAGLLAVGAAAYMYRK